MGQGGDMARPPLPPGIHAPSAGPPHTPTPRPSRQLSRLGIPPTPRPTPGPPSLNSHRARGLYLPFQAWPTASPSMCYVLLSLLLSLQLSSGMEKENPFFWHIHSVPGAQLRALRGLSPLIRQPSSEPVAADQRSDENMEPRSARDSAKVLGVTALSFAPSQIPDSHPQWGVACPAVQLSVPFLPACGI